MGSFEQEEIMKKLTGKLTTIVIGIAKLAAFPGLFPLVAVAALGVTVVEICTPGNWSKQEWNVIRS